MKASLGLHKTMLTKLINSKMWVFNMNSSGEILNRFSQDIGMIDDLLPLVSLDSYQVIKTKSSYFYKFISYYLKIWYNY